MCSLSSGIFAAVAQYIGVISILYLMEYSTIFIKPGILVHAWLQRKHVVIVAAWWHRCVYPAALSLPCWIVRNSHEAAGRCNSYYTILSRDIIPELLPAHDVIPYQCMCHGIGKSKIIKILKFARLHVTCSLIACTSKQQPSCAHVIMCRMQLQWQNVWTSKTGRKTATKIPKLWKMSL